MRKKIQIDDENINLFHAVSEKEYGTIRFTGISGTEGMQVGKLEIRLVQSIGS